MTTQRPLVPSLIGVIHLDPLPGSPRHQGSIKQVIDAALRDATVLTEAAFDAIIIENFGDAPFFPSSVPPITISAMTACACAIRERFPNAVLGVNALRNDPEAALAIAVASRSNFIRINVHTNARVTDQGLIQGQAHRTLRLRAELGASQIALLCDIDVKHSAALAERSIDEEVDELSSRGLADAILVTGAGTGVSCNLDELTHVLRRSPVPVLVASGVSLESIGSVRDAHGVIVGSSLRTSGHAGDPIDPQRAQSFAEGWRRRSDRAR